LFLLLFIAVFANFLANDKPYVCKQEGEWYFPVFRELAVEVGLAQWPVDQANRKWIETKDNMTSDFWPPVPYSPEQVDIYISKGVGPFDAQAVASWRWRHWLGTDDLGRDVLASLIWGTRVAMIIGIMTMLLGGFIGLLLGSLAGYFGNDRLRVSRSQWWGGIIGALLGIYWGVIIRRPLLDTDREVGYLFGAFVLLLLGTWLGSWLGGKLVRGKHLVAVPVDAIVMRIIETITAIPGLLLLLSIAAILPQPSIQSVVIILSLLIWTGIARFVRGEMLQIRELEYLQAAKVLGVSPWRSLWRHALPNALGPVYVALAFSVAGAILIEASLSFLNIGMPADVASWGKLLRYARTNPNDWWLAVFPGLAIFVTVTIFNLLGEAVSEEG
jgi:peptide/nickel transport system permease protein